MTSAVKMGVAVTIKIKIKYYTHDCSRDLKEDAFRADPVPKANLIDDLTSGPHLTKWGGGAEVSEPLKALGSTPPRNRASCPTSNVSFHLASLSCGACRFLCYTQSMGARRHSRFLADAASAARPPRLRVVVDAPQGKTYPHRCASRSLAALLDA